MADIPLSWVAGDDKFISFYSGTLQLASGAAAGDIITITPPAGKRVIIVTLMSGAAESGITLSGSVEGAVISSKVLQGQVTNVVGSFAIAQVIGTTNMSVGAGNILSLKFAIDSVVTVQKSGGPTASIIYYSYAYGS